MQHQIGLHAALSSASKVQGAEGEEGKAEPPFAWLTALLPAPGTVPRHAETVPDKEPYQNQPLAVQQLQGPASPSGLQPITSILEARLSSCGSARSCELQQKRQGPPAAPQQAEVEAAFSEPQVASQAGK